VEYLGSADGVEYVDLSQHTFGTVLTTSADGSHLIIQSDGSREAIYELAQAQDQSAFAEDVQSVQVSNSVQRSRVSLHTYSGLCRFRERIGRTRFRLQSRARRWTRWTCFSSLRSKPEARLSRREETTASRSIR
jgi:hypothetical protein